MISAFCWGLLATSSLILGGLIATRLTLSRKVVGIIMAFGAGTLISAVSYELILEAVQMARLTGFPSAGSVCRGDYLFCLRGVDCEVQRRETNRPGRFRTIQAGRAHGVGHHPGWDP